MYFSFETCFLSIDYTLKVSIWVLEDGKNKIWVHNDILSDTIPWTFLEPWKIILGLS